MTRAVAILIGSVLLGACSQPADSSGRGREGSPETPSAALRSERLSGRTWALASDTGSDQPGASPDSSAPTLVFEFETPVTGRMHGNAGCNRYFTSFQIEAPAWRVEPPGATRKLCESPGIMRSEREFLETIEDIQTVRLDDDGSLLLKDAEGKALRFAVN